MNEKLLYALAALGSGLLGWWFYAAVRALAVLAGTWAVALIRWAMADVLEVERKSWKAEAKMLMDCVKALERRDSQLLSEINAVEILTRKPKEKK